MNILFCVDFMLEQHSKQYDDTENQLRKRIFLASKQMIEEHNEKYKAGEETFEMGLNKYSDLSHDEYMNQLNGVIFDPNME